MTSFPEGCAPKSTPTEDKNSPNVYFSLLVLKWHFVSKRKTAGPQDPGSSDAGQCPVGYKGGFYYSGKHPRNVSDQSLV